MEAPEQTYTKGFNDGYLLSQHDPELLAQILKTKSSNEYLKGVSSGKKQHDKEKVLKEINSKKSKAKDKDREI